MHVDEEKTKERASSPSNLTDPVVQNRMIKSSLSFQIFKKMFFIFNKQMIFFFDVSATISSAFFCSDTQDYLFSTPLVSDSAKVYLK